MSDALASGWSIVAWVGLVVALTRIVAAHRRLPARDRLAWAWRAIALVGFAVTWTFMIRMALDDVARYPSLASWGRGSNLFFDAYRRVTGTPASWWWSQHLMGWALAGALWFAVEGRRRAIRFWAYPWLAMCVAVSVALPLFARRLREAPVVAPRAGLPRPVAIGLAVSFAALVATPFARGAWFVAAMLALHAGILAPAIGTPRSPSPGRDVARRTAARAVGLACFALHVVATALLLGTPSRALVSVVVDDPAQASITSDVVLTWLACGLLVATARGWKRGAVFLAMAPVVSLGAGFAWVLGEERDDAFAFAGGDG